MRERSEMTTSGDDDDDSLVHVGTTTSALARGEIEAQLDAAHKYPRSVTRFLRDATTLATLSQETAESCIYSIPRDGKLIAGPSVRLAEICASAYGNLHVGARIVDVEETVIVAQGGAWDCEKNLRVTVETRRKIIGKNNRRYSEDMIVVTGNAAASIALRNAIFRVVPRSYVNQIYGEVCKVAVGDAQTLVDRRTKVLDRLQKMGVSMERVLFKLGKHGVADIGLEELQALIGLGTAIKSGEESLDEVFPAPAPTPAPAPPAEDGKRISLKQPPKAEPTSEPKDPSRGSGQE